MIKKVRAVLDKFENIFATVSLLIGIFLMFINVVMRYCFKLPITWIDEVSIVILVWGMSFGYSINMRNDEFVKLDLIYNKLSSRGQKFLDFFAYVVGICFSSLLLYYGCKAVLMQKEMNRVLPITEFPRWIVYLIIVIVGVQLLVRHIDLLIRWIKANKEESVS